jgi:virginiamycin B lyase
MFTVVRLTLAVVAALQAPAAVPKVQIQEWPVPWERSRPRDPYVAPDGRVWFVGQTADYAAVLDPTSGDFRRYELEPGTGPHNLIVAPDGMVWYAGNRAAHIGRLDPASGKITKFPMPDPAARDPHTLVWGPDGNLWFTVQGGNRVGHLDVKSGAVQLAEPSVANARPYGIKVGNDNRAWVVLFNSNRIAVVEPRTMAMREYPLPREGARPRRLEIAKDGGIWYVDYAGGFVGRLDPTSGAAQEWAAPSGAQSRPYGTAMDAAGRLWLVETGVQPNVLVAFDPSTREFANATPIPSGGGTVRHMYYDASTNSIWFGTDTNTIGRARLP